MKKSADVSKVENESLKERPVWGQMGALPKRTAQKVVKVPSKAKPWSNNVKALD